MRGVRRVALLLFLLLPSAPSHGAPLLLDHSFAQSAPDSSIQYMRAHLDDRTIEPWQRDIMRQMVRGHDEILSGARDPATPRIQWFKGTRRPDNLSNVIDPPSMPAGYGVYDPAADRMVVASYGTLQALTLGDLSTWEAFDISGPAHIVPGRTSVVYDPVRSRMLIFGGAYLGTYYNEVWALSLTGTPTWTQVQIFGLAPPVRYGSSMIYDPVRDRLVLFGGRDPNGILNDTWTLNLSGSPQWAQLAPTMVAPRRSAGAGVYDPTRDQFVIAGGSDSLGSYFGGDYWTLSLANPTDWVVHHPGGTPGPGDYGASVYDAPRDQLVLFPSNGTTWTLPLSGAGPWRQLVTAHSPGGHQDAAYCYDASRHRLIISGGSGSGGTLALNLDGSPDWTPFAQCQPTVAPAGAWSQLPSLSAALYGATATYDPIRNRLLVFGGVAAFYGAATNNMWQLSLGPNPQWTPLPVSGNLPDARYGHAAAYDPVRDRLLVFGGYSPQHGGFRSDVWALGLTGSLAWSQIQPVGATHPWGRIWTQAVYDPVRDRLVVFGGDSTWVESYQCCGDCPPIPCCGSSTQVREDALDPAIWALNLSGTPAWGALGPSGLHPLGRFGHGMAYDPAGDRLILHGGMYEDHYSVGSYCPVQNVYFDVPFSDTWAFAFSGTPAWTRLSPVGCSPEARGYETMVADPSRNRVLITGGTPVQTTWELPLDTGASWVQLTPENSSASGRFQGFGAYDPSGDQLLVLGGVAPGGFSLLSDAWALQFSGSASLHITTPTALPNATPEIPYAASLSASGGAPPYAWRANPSTLPPGLSVSSNGALSGTLHGTNYYTMLLAVTDAVGAQAIRVFSLSSITPVSVQSSSPLTSATVQSPYSFTLVPGGGRPPYSWSLSSGALPQGLTLDLTGFVHGTTADSGSHAFTIHVTDSSGSESSKPMALSVQVLPLHITSPATLPPGLVGHGYQAALSAAGGLTPRTWSAAPGSMPAGLVLDPTGALGGTPTTRQSATFPLMVTDLAGNTATQICSLRVDLPPVQVTSNANVGTAFYNHPFSKTLTASGGAPPYTWSLVSGSLPAGVLLSPGGVIAGAATSPGDYNFVVAALDTEGTTGQLAMTLMVQVAPSISTISPLPGANVGFFYQEAVHASGGSAPYSWSLVAGALPTGLSLSPQGVISGTPASSGTFGFVIRVADALGDTAGKAFTMAVVDSAYILTHSLPLALASQAFGFQLLVAGLHPPVTWTLISGALPAGIVLQPDGVVAGTTVLLGSFGFGVRATGTDGPSVSASLTLVVGTANFMITDTALPEAYTGESYLDSLHATGGTPPRTWGVLTGTLPSGMQFSADGILSGIPGSTGNYSVTVRVTDSQSAQATASFVLHVNAGLAIIPPLTLPSAFVGVAYLGSLGVAGGLAPYSWSITGGTLPSGIDLQGNGVVQGMSSSIGDYSFTARVQDSRGRSTSSGGTLRVENPNSLFAQVAPVTPGSGPSSIVSVDLDGDGRPDLLTSNFGAGAGSTLSYLAGLGAGAFSARADYAAGSGPRALVATDLDGIAGPEVAVADWTSGNVSVLSATGGIPALQSSFFSGFYPSDIAEADLDGDGFADLAVSNFGSSSVVLFFNQADGTFQLGSSPRTGSGPMRLAVMDMDGDGAPDLVTANPGAGTVSFLRGRGDGTFFRKKDFAAGTSPRALAILDADIDGIPDIAVADSASGVVRLLRGLGAGNFSAPVSFTVGLGPVAIAAADLDGDGIADLLVANSGESSVTMLKGRGDGSFFDRTDSPTGAGPLSLASGDFNGDSRPDVAVLCAGNNSITVLLNTGASWVTPVAVSDLEAEWSATGATLHWKFFGSNGSAVRVQRAGVGRSYVDVSVDLLADPGAAAMTFVDASAAAGNSYIYRLAWRERGAVHTSSEVHLAPPGLAFSLGEPVPNPTAGSVSFRFALPSQSVARLEILDVSGRRVRLILDAVRSPGPGSATWDGRGVDGSPMPAGIYFARLEAAGRVLRRRVMMLK